jgi:NAD(P)-dependent dehydrogenase (short-subunit alcohol dehydrogenase family)
MRSIPVLWSLLGVAGQSDDIAPLVAFLASDESACVTGERITASGGSR